MALDNLYEQEFASAGPRARGPLKRSYYLQRALDEIGKGPKNLTPASTVTNLIAEALLQYGRNKQDKKAQAAEVLDSQESADRMMAMLGGGGPSAPSPVAPTPPPSPLASAASTINLAPNMDMGAVAKSRDLLARIVAGESATDPGQQAAASVIFNRANQSGLTPDQVATARGQFEPYGNKQTWRGLQNLDPQAMARALSNVDAASGSPTTDADHFYSPSSQRVLASRDGRPLVPDFDRGQPSQMIGGNKFMQAGYQAPTQRGAIQPPISTLPPGGPQMPPQAPQQPPPMAAAPQASAAPGGPQARGMSSITPELRQYVETLMKSPDPRERARGTAMAQAAIAKSLEPVTYQNATANGVPFAYDPQDPSHTQAFPPIPGTQNLTMSAQQAGIGAAPRGSTVSVDPFGKPTMVYQPPQGYQSGADGRQSFVPGSGEDPYAGKNRAEAIFRVQDQIKPIIQRATLVQQHVNAIREGIRQQNGAGDIAIVNGVQKLTDEGVVKGEDVSMQLQALGLPGSVAGMLQYLKGGGVFTPEQRASLGRVGEGLYTANMQSNRAQALALQGFAERNYGAGADVLDPRVIQDFGWGDAPAKPAAASLSASQSAGARTPNGFTQAQAQAALPYLHATGPVGAERRPYTPRTQAEFDGIPKGAWYISDDGYKGRK